MSLDDAQRKMNKKYRDYVSARADEDKEGGFVMGIFLGIFLSLTATIIDRSLVETVFYNQYVTIVIAITGGLLLGSILVWRSSVKVRKEATKALEVSYEEVSTEIKKSIESSTQGIEKLTRELKKSLKVSK